MQVATEGVLNMRGKSDIEIAREAEKKPIQDVGAKLGIAPEYLLPFGPVSYTHLTLPTNREV